MALLAIKIPNNYIPIITMTPSIETINAVFAMIGKYRHTPIKSLGQFIEEVYRMIRQMPALRVDLDSVQVYFEEVSIQDSLNRGELQNMGLSGSSSLISSENQWFTLNRLVDDETDCLHPNGVLLLLSLPPLRNLNIQRGSNDLARVKSVEALVDSATMDMPFSPDVPAASQVQFLRLVRSAKLDARWVDVIDWMTEKSHLQHAIAYKVFGETSEKLRPCADMLDLRRVLIRVEYEDMAQMLAKLGSATPQKVVELADTLGLAKLSNMHSYVAAISDKVHEIPSDKVAMLLQEPASFVVRLKAESQNVIDRAKAFGKHRTPARSVNCFDGGTYEGFVRDYSGEAAALLAMLDSEDPIKIEYWIHHVFSEASGPLKAFCFLTMIRPEKTERFGASELDKLVGLLRLNFHQYISDEVITHGMGRPALALGANFLLDKPDVSGLFTGATLMEDFMAILDKRHMAAHSVGPGTYHKKPKDFKQALALFGLVRHVSQAVGFKEPPVVSSFQERMKIAASIGYRSTDFSGPTVTLDGLWNCYQEFHELLPQYMDQMLLPMLIKLYNEAMRAIP